MNNNTRRLSINETIRAVQELQSRNIKNRTEELNEEIIRHQRLLRLFDKTEAESGIKRAKTEQQLAKLIYIAVTNDKEWNALSTYLNSYAHNKNAAKPWKERMSSRIRMYKLTWIDDNHTVRSLAGPYVSDPLYLTGVPNRRTVVCWWVFEKDGEFITTIVNTKDMTLEELNKTMETVGSEFRFKSFGKKK